MTKEEFQKLWAANYSDTVQISYLFKKDFANRWFRIHSLPESKRYADNDDEWEILLTRQNEIITDLLGFNTPVLLVTGDYTDDWKAADDEVLKSYSFTQLDDIDLHKIDSKYYDEAVIYKPVFTEIIWKPNQYDDLLREIAGDNMRAFFWSFAKNIIVAPYDGGIDFVLKNSETRDFYKNKYRQWLSGLESGL